MMKKVTLMLFLIVFSVCFSVSVYADDESRYWTPSDYEWIDDGEWQRNDNEAAFNFDIDFNDRWVFKVGKVDDAPLGSIIKIIGHAPKGWKFLYSVDMIRPHYEEDIRYVLSYYKKIETVPPSASSITNSTNGGPVTENTYTVYANNVTDNATGIPKVDFYTWTDANGQDDLIKTDGIPDASNNRWYANVNISEHNSEKGKYITHVYAEDDFGNYGKIGEIVTIVQDPDSKVPFASSITTSTNGNPVRDNTYTIYANNVNDDVSGVKNVDFYTWTDANGQDDLVKTAGTYDASNNRWYANVSRSEHNSETGNYITHVYAGDNAGNYGVIGNIVTTVKSASEGSLDYVNANSIYGWAWQPSMPNQAIDVHIYIDGKFAGAITADAFRQDLLNAGKGNGNHGFNYSINWSAYAAGSHLVEAYAVDGSDHNPKIGSKNFVTDPIPFKIDFSINKSTFYDSENWQYNISTTPTMANQPITCTIWRNGALYTKDSQVGTTDANGQFVITGKFSPDLVGDWTEQVKIGNTLSNTIAFKVVPTPYKIDFSINKSTFYDSDNWQYNISTTPTMANQPITCTMWKNGALYTKDSQVGTTDANGRFVITGKFSPDLLGDWTQQIKIGNTISNKITFKILPSKIDFSINKSTFYDSDNWQYNISTTPTMANQPITCTIWRNGTLHTKDSAVGTTDSNGKFVLTGKFSPDLVGNWRMQVKIGNTISNIIEFNVLATPPKVNFSINKSTFYATDNWQYNISTTPTMANQPITCTIWRNGTLHTKDAAIGTTDANGKFVLTGRFSPDLVGDWTQQVKIGNTLSNTISFKILPTPKN